MSWPEPGVDRCMRIAYRRPGGRLDPLLALVARVRRRAYGELYQCGLLFDHDGKCTWFTPGDYLPPPLMPPWLDVTRHQDIACPVCLSLPAEWIREPTTVVYASTGGGMGEVREEVRWRFEPCGHEGREILCRDVQFN